MEIKVDNKNYQIKFGMEEEIKNLFAPYEQKHEIKESYEVDLMRIIIEGIIFEVSRKVFIKKIYPYFKDLIKETF